MATTPEAVRDDTDASLRAEREKSDREILSAGAAIDKAADEVVEAARERADETLRLARERADRDAVAGGSTADQTAVVRARAAEDKALVREQSAADDHLEGEREQRRRVLSALRLEREATDDGLLVERALADRALATRDDFLGIVTHDLRNMLSGVVLSAGLLQKHANTESGGGAVTLRHVTIIQRFAARMNHLVGDLLDVVSLEAGKLRITPRQLDAVAVAVDAVETFQALFTAKGITLVSVLGGASISAVFDHDRILQVLANLLSNALKFTDHGGVVTVAVARTDSSVQFTVTDTGIGIPPEQAATVFERFRKLSPNDVRGHGLGLYIAKCIVDAHGGVIWAESLPIGTAMHFTVPLVPSTARPVSRSAPVG
jgi:signal transduction histidine kinase